jgi:hypothetical protein
VAEQKQNHDLAININLDTTPVLYTDNIFMNTNEDGVVFNFGQMLGSMNQLRVVSRIGMSRNHAKKFLQEFGKLLALTEGQMQTGEKKKN